MQVTGLKASKKVEEELRYQLSMQDELNHRLQKALKQVESLEATRRQYIEKVKVICKFNERLTKRLGANLLRRK